jgi:hypothetical protein
MDRLDLYDHAQERLVRIELVRVHDGGGGQAVNWPELNIEHGTNHLHAVSLITPKMPMLYAELDRHVDDLPVDSRHREAERDRFSLDTAHARLVNLPNKVSNSILGKKKKGRTEFVDSVDGIPELLNRRSVLNPLRDPRRSE